MFNLNKWVKSWFSGSDVTKTASHHNVGLENSRKDQGTYAEEDPMIVEKNFERKDKEESKAIIEARMSKESNSDHQIAEARMEKELEYSVRKNDDFREEVPRISVATEKHDQAYRAAYAKAEKELTKQHDLFEKYMGKGGKKVPANVPASANGLVTNPERFQNFDGVPGEDVQENLKNISERSAVKPMHTVGDLDSIKKLDAAAYYVAFKAASSGREMNKEETDVIKSIIQKKRKILQS
jgi:hypothetical protein